MKRYLKPLLILILFSLYLSASNPIFAHTLKTDGPIGAVIHINPEDDPIVGQPADFFFEFKDKEGNFKAEDCICQAAILKDNQTLATESLSPSTNLTSSSFSYTFPEKGVYKIEVTGEPTKGTSFKNFKITYDLRIERTSGTTSQQTNFFLDNFHFIALGLVALVFVISFFLSKRKTKKTNLKGTGFSLFLLIFALSFLAFHTQSHQLLPKHHQSASQTNQAEKHAPCCLPQSNAPTQINSFDQPLLFAIDLQFSDQFFYETKFLSDLNSRSPPSFKPV